MRKSKLERYVGILENLARARNFASQGAMELTQLMQKTGLSKKVLKQRLNFLIQQNLVEEQNLGKDAIFYVITGRGVRVLNIVAPMISEARKSQALLH